MNRILLINMPFAAIESPSLALGLFKTRFINERIPCNVYYLNILFAEMIGWENYNFITHSPAIFAGEQLFAHILFSDQIPDDSKYYTDIVIPAKLPLEVPYRLQQIKTKVIPFLHYCLESVPWHYYDIIGFSSLFEQNLPSLALAYQVKQRYPNKIIVFGGANCEEIMGLTLHKCFPFVDYVCSGEGDSTFPDLVNRLNFSHPVNDLPGIVYRYKGESVYTGRAPMIQDLDTLPIPNYDEYFQQLRSNAQAHCINPILLFETSRGCWWGEKLQCTFCGLNGENLRFRSKSTQRIISEILYLVQHYNIRSLRAVDNVLNPRYFNDVLPEIARMRLNTQIIFETRVNIQKHQVKVLAKAGIRIIQAGIENLSTNILKLMRKGTSALKNIQLLKWCKQYQVQADWNMIFGFPGETQEDYKRCLELANILTHLYPPSGFGPIRMDRFSPNFNNAKELGFINLRPLKNYKYLYPFDADTLFDLAYYFDFDYRAKINGGGYITPLTEAIWRWKSRQDQLYAQSVNGMLVIYDSRPVAASTQIVLTDNRANVYEYCDKIRSLKQIEQWLKVICRINLSTDQIKMILDEFVEKKLMVKEKNLYLSLAILINTPELGERVKTSISL